MSDEINLGADWEQSKRLVKFWHDRWGKEQASVTALTWKKRYENLCAELQAIDERVNMGIGEKIEITPEGHSRPSQIRVIIVPEKMDEDRPKGFGG